MDEQLSHGRMRSWARFSLRSLVLLLALASVLFGYVAYEQKKSEQQRKAYDALNALNGSVTLDEERSQRWPWIKFILGDDSYSYVKSIDLIGDPSESEPNPRDPTDEKIAPFRFLTRTQEIRFDNMSIQNESLAPLRNFHELKVMALTRCPLITGEGLTHLTGLKKLEELDLRQMDTITDDGMAHLAALPSLEALNLSQTNMGDGGLKHVAKNKRLKRLILADTKVTREGMKFLADLSDLQVLSLLNVPIGDSGFEHLQNLNQLEVLDLYGTKITDRSLPFIGRMKKLQSLNLGTAVAATVHPAARRSFAPIPPDASSSHITNEGIGHLRNLTDLESLDLSNSQVTDVGLSHLQAMKKLRTLDLTGTAVTDEGLIHLEQLPELNLLFLDATAVTEEGARKLAAKLDNVHASVTKDGRHLNVGKSY